MAKVVMMPRTNMAMTSPLPEKSRCAFTLEGREIVFDCLGCPMASDAPTHNCLAGFRSALEANPEACGIVLHGEQQVWIRECGLESLRSLICAEKAWDDFRSIIRSLPCHRPLAVDRINRYLERIKEGRAELFCLGEGAICQGCEKIQQDALSSLRSNRRKARRTVAADRFRITEVLGGGQK